MIKHLEKEDFHKEIEKGAVLVDFYATWCGPCKMMEPILEKLSKEKDIKVIKVDVDQHEDLAREYGVMSIPNLFLFKDGKRSKESGWVFTLRTT